MGAEKIRIARAQMAATVANEVLLNSGRPVGDDNPHYAAAKKRLDDAIAEDDAASDPWNNA